MQISDSEQQHEKVKYKIIDTLATLRRMLSERSSPIILLSSITNAQEPINTLIVVY